MKETGVIFPTEDVRAIRDGRKTCFRRPFSKRDNCLFDTAMKIGECTNFHRSGVMHQNDPTYAIQFSPFGQVGDLIYVRETFGHSKDKYHKRVYKAGDQAGNVFPVDKWIPSSQMPKDAARLWLEITKEWIEPVRDIDPYEAWKEGFRCNGSIHPSSCIGNIEDFKNNWESRYPGSWSRNDFVWVTEFKVVER